jgi:hypothetical protein
VTAVAVAVLAGCNAVLGIHPALNEEWDGGRLGDGAPAAVQTGSTGSTFAGSTSSAAGPTDAGPVAQWADWPMPNPPSIVPSLPHPQSYDTSSPNIVTDRVTGLEWQAAGDGTLYTYVDAVAYCAALQVPSAGGGWRLPSRIELMSIVDNTQEPRIDGKAFAMPAGDASTVVAFWASSLLAGDNSHAWIVDFGMSTNLLVTAQIQPAPGQALGRSFVRCVRGPM